MALVTFHTSKTFDYYLEYMNKKYYDCFIRRINTENTSILGVMSR